MEKYGQRLARIEHDAWQSRLAMEADGPPDTKTRERTEGAVTAVRAMHGDSCSANRVDPDPMCSISFCDDCTGPPTPPCSGENALIDNGAATPKSCLILLEMRTTAAGGFLPTGKTSTATKTTFDHNSSALPNRRDKFEAFVSTRLVRQQLLEELPACCALLP